MTQLARPLFIVLLVVGTILIACHHQSTSCADRVALRRRRRSQRLDEPQLRSRCSCRLNDLKICCSGSLFSGRP